MKASIKFSLPLATERALLLAAHSGKEKRARALLQDQMKVQFGAFWKQGFIKMLDDFEQVMKVEQSDQTYRQKLKALRDLQYLETYNAQQRQHFSLMLRRLLAVYDLFYKKPVALKKGAVYVDQYLLMTSEWLRAARYMLNNFL